MILSPVGRTVQIFSLALLITVLGAGVPLRGHSHHEGGSTHFGPPEQHSHGFTLVQHEMRLERGVIASVFVVAEGLVLIPPPSPKPIQDLPACDERF
ncbi:MAG: hypothetical protein ACC682_16715, partial [Gemmatimonadota bacterium]